MCAPFFFLGIRKSMAVIGVPPEEQTDIFRLLAAILHLGNLTFKSVRDQAEIESKDTAALVAKLLGGASPPPLPPTLRDQLHFAAFIDLIRCS